MTSGGLRLTAEEIVRYRRDGLLIRPRALAAELEKLRALVEEVITGVITRARRPEAAGEFTLGDGHRMQVTSDTLIQWEWADGSQEVRLIEPFTHLHPGFDR